MRHAGFTKQERVFIALMRIWAVAFALAGIIFAIAPDYILNYIADFGRVMFRFYSPAIQVADERFWLVLAVTMLFLLSYICIFVQKNLVQYIHFATAVIFAKFLSCLGFGICFFTQGGQFIYLAGFAIDGAIFLLTWRLYSKALKSRA